MESERCLGFYPAYIAMVPPGGRNIHKHGISWSMDGCLLTPAGAAEYWGQPGEGVAGVELEHGDQVLLHWLVSHSSLQLCLDNHRWH